jgi:hypothetical protein
VVTLFVPDQSGQPVREIALTELDDPADTDPAGVG